MVLRQQEDALTWEQNHETILIQPWGPGSLRIRGTLGIAILDLPGALLPPSPGAPVLDVGEEQAALHNGQIEAQVSKAGQIRFFKAGGSCWKNPNRFSTAHPARLYRALDGDLPAGADWTDPWTGEKHTGGRWIQTPAPLERVPVYVRGNRQLPFK